MAQLSVSSLNRAPAARLHGPVPAAGSRHIAAARRRSVVAMAAPKAQDEQGIFSWVKKSLASIGIGKEGQSSSKAQPKKEAKGLSKDYKDPLEEMCDSAPDADECRVYDD